jgi:hypothetical protein
MAEAELQKAHASIESFVASAQHLRELADLIVRRKT